MIGWVFRGHQLASGELECYKVKLNALPANQLTELKYDLQPQTAPSNGRTFANPL